VGAPAVVQAPRAAGAPGDADAARRLAIAPALSAVPGVRLVTGVTRLDGQIAGGDVSVLAVDADGVAAATVGAGPARVSAAEAARLRGARPALIPLPGSGPGSPATSGSDRRLVVTVTTTVTHDPATGDPSTGDLSTGELATGDGSSGSLGTDVTVTALVTGPDGVPQRLPLGTVAAGGAVRELAVALPRGATALSALQVEGSPAGGQPVTARLRPAVVTGGSRTPLAVRGWAVALASADGEAVAAPGRADEMGVRLAAGPSTLPVSARVGPPWTVPGAVPALVDRRLAAVLGELSGGAGLQLPEGSVTLQVVGYLDAVPGLAPEVAAPDAPASSPAPGVLVDLPTLAAADLSAGRVVRAPTEWWVSGSGPDPDAVALAAAARTVIPDRGAVTVVTRAQAERALTGLPLSRGMTRLLLITAVALAALAGTALMLSEVIAARRRRGELAALRAVGLSRTQLRRLVVAEQVVGAGIAAVAGVAAGVVLARLVVPVLVGPVLPNGASMATADAAPASLPWAWAAAVLVGALALIAVSAGARGSLAGRLDAARVLRSEAS
jgi:hypothetical protein